jgi:uncharacterized protein (TIGR02058 family)
MSRVSIKTRNDLPEALRPLWDKMTTYGAFENQAGVMVHRPPIFQHIWSLLVDLADHGVLSKRHLELALVAASQLNQCSYCVSHHAPKLTVQGVSAEGVERLLQFSDHPELDEVDADARRDLRAAARAFLRGADRGADLAHRAVRRLQPFQRRAAARCRGRRAGKPRGRIARSGFSQPRNEQDTTMARVRCITEMGMGVDVHGRDATKAAKRAVSDAIRHSSLGFFRMVGKTANDMFVDVTIAVPNPEAVDTAVVAKELPYGTVKVSAVKGGLEIPAEQGTDSILIANAAVIVSFDDDKGG